MKSILLICILLLSLCYNQTPVNFSILEQAQIPFTVNVEITTPKTVAKVYLQLGFTKKTIDSLNAEAGSPYIVGYEMLIQKNENKYGTHY